MNLKTISYEGQVKNIFCSNLVRDENPEVELQLAVDVVDVMLGQSDCLKNKDPLEAALH